MDEPRDDSELDDYFEQVLYFAEPGGRGPSWRDESAAPIGPAARWSAWCARRADEITRQEPAIAALALPQGFAARTDQLATLGLTRHAVRLRLRSGDWDHPQRGAVTLLGDVASAPDPVRARHAASTAAGVLLNPGYVATHRSAAALRGLPTLELPARPELSAPRESTSARLRVSALPDADLTQWYGVALTSVARTVVDCARLDRREGIVVADAALRERLTTPAELAAAVTAQHRWRGTRQAREIVALADGRSESPFESITRLSIHDAGLPMPEPQFRIPVPGRRHPLRVDFGWSHRRLILEADGRGKYHGDALWQEKRREKLLRRLGYRIERVVWADVVHEWPATELWLRELLTP